MSYTPEQIYAVRDKCDRRCVYGERRGVTLTDYRKTWEIDHATPLSRGA